MAMVKLETWDGKSAWIEVSSVSALYEGGYSDTTHVRCDGMDLTVKGTPDEVHARLFPEKDPNKAARMEQMRHFLESGPARYAASTEDEAWGVPKRPFEADPDLTGINSVVRGERPHVAETVKALYPATLTVQWNADRARDACGEACTALIQALPPEEAKRLAEALDAANFGEEWDMQRVEAQPATAADVIRLLAFAVRRLSGREG